MASWLEYPNSSNKIKQTYILGFLDVSGGDIINRNGNTILNNNLYVKGDSLFIGEIVTNDISVNGNVTIPTGNLQNTIDLLTKMIIDLTVTVENNNDNLQNKINNQTAIMNNYMETTDLSLNILTTTVDTNNNNLQNQINNQTATMNNYIESTDASLIILTQSLNSIYQFFFKEDLTAVLIK